MRRTALGLAALSLVLVLTAASRPLAASSVPAARVGAFYFDGWSGETTNFHFSGLAYPGPNGQFPSERPLYGWRDNTMESMRTQLSWAHQDGISFFVFDWFIDPSYGVDNAHDNYLKLRDHHGVGFALMYVGNDQFGIPLDNWPRVVDRWVTQDFLNPDYERVNGKPILFIYEVQHAAKLWGGAPGVNTAIRILQDAAKRHGLPGVFVVGLRQDYWDYSRDCVITCGYDGDLINQRYDALSKYTFNLVTQPTDGAIPYSHLITDEERNWDRYAAHSPFAYIPSVPAGWDSRPSDERPEGHLFWFTRSPAEVGNALSDAIAWVDRNAGMRVEPAPAPPIVLIEAWNELQEGAYVLPTDQDGYSYGHSIAAALGIPWSTSHARRIAVKLWQRRLIRGTLVVTDDWSPCDDFVSVVLERKSSDGWIPIRSSSTRPGGSFAMRAPMRSGSFRVSVPPAVVYQQTCDAAVSRTFRLQQ